MLMVLLGCTLQRNHGAKRNGCTVDIMICVILSWYTHSKLRRACMMKIVKLWKPQVCGIVRRKNDERFARYGVQGKPM
nr:MAG TPA: hypothetical protein [Caudoviricetes sp.]